MFAQTTVYSDCGVPGAANTRRAKARRYGCLGECLESAVLSTPSTNGRCGVATYAGGCKYPKSLRGALFAVGLQMSAVVAAQPPSGTFVVAYDVPSRQVFGECGSLHAECSRHVVSYRGCEYPKSLCRRWCFVAGVGDGDACCCANLVSLLVRGISLRRSVRYWYVTLRGGHWSS